jgi:Papain family cysteine protease
MASRLLHLSRSSLTVALVVALAAFAACDPSGVQEQAVAPQPQYLQAPPQPEPPPALQGTVPGAPSENDDQAQPPTAAPSTMVGTGRTPLIVINLPSKDPLPPPPIAKPPQMVALPRLPSPAHYPKHSTPTNMPETEPCGMTWTGAEWVPTGCIEPPTVMGTQRTAQVVIPYDKMPTIGVPMPALVDHRVEGTEGVIRHQGGSQCTAFAFTEALDHDYARWTGQAGYFSTMQVWARYHKHDELNAATGNVGDFVANEADWPFVGATASTWTKCPDDPSKRKPGKACSIEPDPMKLVSLDSTPTAVITQIEVLPLTQLGALREKIASGNDVVVGIKLHSFQTAGDPGAKYVIGEPAEPSKKGFKHHEILLAGYAMTPNGNYYLMHNSWGVGWGDNGFAWIHEDVLRAYSFGGVFVIPELQPKQVADLRLRPDTGLTPMCPAGQAPDSISGVCVGKCTDGSPRHNNVCAPSANPCPAGMVNLIGACEMSAPKSAGKDRLTGVSWECGPGGCAYGIPGNSLGCRAAECQVSCPAPEFRLATAPSGLVCVD